MLNSSLKPFHLRHCACSFFVPGMYCNSIFGLAVLDSSLPLYFVGFFLCTRCFSPCPMSGLENTVIRRIITMETPLSGKENSMCGPDIRFQVRHKSAQGSISH